MCRALRQSSPEQLIGDPRHISDRKIELGTLQMNFVRCQQRMISNQFETASELVELFSFASCNFRNLRQRWYCSAFSGLKIS